MERNFALFSERDNVIWTFGDLDDDFIESCTKFLQGLDSFGHELFGEGVATIKLDKSKSPGGDNPEEIFCLTLDQRFYFIVSDPLITLRLMEFRNIPSEFKDSINATLAGQALFIYANLFEKWGTKLDKLYHEALTDVGIHENLKRYANNGVCSFSGLNQRQLCLFHYFLRQRFESQEYLLGQKPWAIINAKQGTKIHLRQGLDINRALITSGFLSVIYTFVEDLFMSLPSRIIFGGDSIVSLDTFAGKNNFLSISSWHSVLKNSDFLDSFTVLDQNIVQDLYIPFTHFLARKLSEEFQEAVKNYPLLDLISVMYYL
ncbi:MAG: hypothetical protein ACTSRU_20605 [Candidatus Hodarchaeales archaeon]